MVKIYQRYIFRELLAPFVLSLAIFSFVLLMGNILKMTELVINKGVNALDMIKLSLYLFPSLFSLTVPMATLICISIAFARLSSDFEIIAMKASGISVYQMFIPVLILSILTWIFTMFLTVYGSSWGMRMFRDLLYDITRRNASIVLKERVFIDDFPGFVLYANRIPEDGDFMEGVLISDKRLTNPSSIIIARKGYFLSDDKEKRLSIFLKDGNIYQSSPEKDSLKTIHFDTYKINIDFNELKGTEGRKIKNTEMTVRELMDKIERYKNEQRDYFHELVDLHKRFSIPFSCIVFGLMGIPLGLQTRPAGKSHGFILGILVIAFYYVIFTFAQAMGERGKVPVVPALWAPNVIMGIMGLYFLIATIREGQIYFLHWMNAIVDRSINWAKRISKRF